MSETLVLHRGIYDTRGAAANRINCWLRSDLAALVSDDHTRTMLSLSAQHILAGPELERPGHAGRGVDAGRVARPHRDRLRQDAVGDEKQVAVDERRRMGGTKPVRLRVTIERTNAYAKKHSRSQISSDEHTRTRARLPEPCPAT